MPAGGGVAAASALLQQCGWLPLLALAQTTFSPQLGSCQALGHVLGVGIVLGLKVRTPGMPAGEMGGTAAGAQCAQRHPADLCPKPPAPLLRSYMLC